MTACGVAGNGQRWLGQDDAQRQNLAVAISVHLDVDVLPIYVDIPLDHLQDIPLKQRKMKGATSIGSLVRYENLKPLLCHRRGVS